jgi:hypothetical protein
VLPLLPPEVDTLAPYGGGRDFVRLADRRDRLDLLAFPRGRSSGRLGARGRWVSRLRRGSWRLSLRAGGPRRYRLQASLPGLRPRSVRLNGRRLGREVWSYDRGSAVFRAAFRGTRSTSLTLNPK